MKNKLFIPFIVLLLVILSACGSDSGTPASSTQNNQDTHNTQNADTTTVANPSEETITYQSEKGPVKVPAHPKRIVALTYAPNVLSLDVPLVGVDQWTNANPLFKDKLEGVTVVSEEDLETIIEQDPDLIIAGTEMKNLDKLGQIAPTVAFTWGKLDYLSQQLEIGKLLNKEQEAQAWIDDFKQRAEAIGSEIKATEGDDVSVSVFETDSAKNFYVFGNNWARGTEILYQAMGLKMPEKVEKDALGPGYFALSQEVLSDYAGDYIVLSRNSQADTAFMKTDIWKGIPAVKNGHVIEIDTEAATYSDPITLEYLLNIFKTGFLGDGSTD
ncbi:MULTISPECIES: iron-hydroxamate ABC transporter substrate-binding protein [Paenibacillus]|jgi:iron complex transport system substrate-binding protein|uniref:Periplasmic binding protein n=2 Tax=Paenibacillus lactis TaxID=228574 RepID=G4HB58_9BACL|nr:iron-hydroxamate ABC transporter substrate-binding protein [Paenibacillus lactis]EHB67167.1 periplasmic binding protein [Paenibacillus lactis 154]MBP1894425.1 iron complex transport system substrate-binding protein [Paenibacillus lactis]GIO94177.1 ABC transporter substrate-binding protein [Paenibacillus lactis]HAF98721.1 ABC transporter substrate-binding protein [Paenibacillus lactis]